MVYDPITSDEIEAGEPTKQELFTKVKENFDDHEDRIGDLEGGTSTTFKDETWNVWGDYSYYGARTQIMIQRLSLNITVLASRLFVHTAGSAGTTEIDFLFKRGVGAWTSIFSTKPSVAFGAGDNAVSSNSVLNPSYVELEAGDLIRMDITSVQTNGEGLTGLITFEMT
jgi:hypothetical protein